MMKHRRRSTYIDMHRTLGTWVIIIGSGVGFGLVLTGIIFSFLRELL